MSSSSRDRDAEAQHQDDGQSGRYTQVTVDQRRRRASARQSCATVQDAGEHAVGVHRPRQPAQHYEGQAEHADAGGRGTADHPRGDQAQDREPDDRPPQTPQPARDGRDSRGKPTKPDNNERPDRRTPHRRADANHKPGVEHGPAPAGQPTTGKAAEETATAGTTEQPSTTELTQQAATTETAHLPATTEPSGQPATTEPAG